MKKSIIISITLFFLGILSANAQVVLKVNIDKIKELTGDITSPNYYTTLLNRFINSDTTLTSRQLHFIYYGQYNQPFYQPLTQPEGRSQMYQSIDIGAYEAALIYGKRAFDLDPLDLKTIYGLAICYHNLGDENQEENLLFQYYSLLSVIVESGSGNSVEDAIVVMSISDELEIISNLGRRIKSQKLLNGTTEIVKLSKSKDRSLNKLKKLYFNIELPLKRATTE